jgi:peptidoglycan hydrolase-like protein with peptidoglycan-binding domain
MKTRTRASDRHSRPAVIVGADRGRRRRWPWALAAGALLVLAALAFSLFAWPKAAIVVGAAGLPEVRSPSFGGRLEQVSLRDARGTAIPVRVQDDGTVWPVHPVTAGTRLFAVAVVRRPSWVGWIAGRTQTLELEVTAPRAQLERRWLRVRPGDPVRVSFDRPVREVRVSGIGAPRLHRLRQPTRAVVLGRLGDAGSVGVSAVSETWEALPPATSVTWFPPGTAPRVLTWPAPGGQLGHGRRIRLRFSQPLGSLLHGRRPAVQPAVPGRWRTVDTHTLEFTPRGYGFGLDTKVRLNLPVAVEPVRAGKATRTIAWQTPVGSELRLEELLALLQYLPLRWTADSADAPRTVARQLRAAADPPAGRFEWRFPDTPAPLRRLWHEGVFTEVVRGAVMAFQNEHGLTVDGFAGKDVWKALIADVIAGKPRQGGYSYVYVHSAVPQSLNLWHDGETILTSPGNTGVPAAPTQLGTFPVFEHIPVGTMSGTNPDGSHYHDPGIRYISYFNHGEAIHAFNRASFGTPQSLGCVELPLAAAAKVWPYTPIGTLVTVER